MLAKPKQKRICFKCRSDKTYFYKYLQWRHDKNGNILCKKCYDKIWRVKYPDYHKVYHLLYREERLNYMKVWHLLYPDYNKIYYLAHREEILNRNKLRRLLHANSQQNIVTVVDL